MAPPKGRKRVEDAADNDDRWLLTYSDMITLLMALFIVMWSISSVNIAKFDELKASLKSAFSGKVLPGNDSVLTGQTAPFDQDGTPVQMINPVDQQPIFSMKSISASITQSAARQDTENLKHIQQEVERYAQQHGFASEVRTTINERGLVVRLLTDKVLFDSGSAVLQPQGLPLLGEISRLLTRADIVNPVRVEGNTDDVPIHSAVYPSNWELSTARADAVLEFLLGKGVKPKRLSVAGYGEQNPIASNATAAGRSTNRRVDLVILRRSFKPASS
jgi:chemotaxis protein MotB